MYYLRGNCQNVESMSHHIATVRQYYVCDTGYILRNAEKDGQTGAAGDQVHLQRAHCYLNERSHLAEGQVQIQEEEV